MQPYFIFADFNSNQSNDYIQVSGNKLFVYSQTDSLLFQYLFENEIVSEPIWIMDAESNLLLLINDSKAKKSYLFSSPYGLVNGFPISCKSALISSQSSLNGSIVIYLIDEIAIMAKEIFN